MLVKSKGLVGWLRAKTMIELTRTKGAAAPTASSVLAQRIRSKRGLKKMPPPIPTIPATKPMAAPAGIASQIGTARVFASLTTPIPKNNRMVTNTSTSPRTNRYEDGFNFVLAAKNAAGMEPSAKRQDKRQTNIPERYDRTTTTRATSTVNDRISGFKTRGDIPERTSTAM